MAIREYNFAYTGGMQTFTAPYTGTYTLEVWGAEGQNRNNSTLGGKGGHAKGTIELVTGDVLRVYVGGYKTGYNGGGYAPWGGYGGGGTDIRKGGSDLSDRVIVAGGGGSVGASNKPGGYGGGSTGQSMTQSYGSGGNGGTQSAGGNNRGTLGKGGDGQAYSSGYGGAGGGGYYGGGGVNPDGSGDDDRGGGGGSGYIGGVSGGTMSSGIRSGHGQAKISFDERVTIEGATVTTPIHDQDVTISATFEHTLGSGNGKYRIHVGGTVVKDFVNVPLPFNMSETLPNKLFKTGSNRVDIELVDNAFLTGNITKSLYVDKNNETPTVTLTGNNPLHGEQFRGQFSISDPDGDMTKYRVLVNDTVVSAWNLLGDYTAPRELVISNKRFNVGANTIRFEMEDDLGDTASRQFTVTKENNEPTVDVTYFQGHTIHFKVDDEDKDKVAYRVLVNDVQQIPAVGFGDYLATPYQVEMEIDHQLVTVDVANKITIEVIDELGGSKSLEINELFGLPGLLFCDENETLYSDHVGYILKTLEHGTLVAGNESPWREVWLRNNLGYSLKNVTLATNQAALDPVHEKIELAYPSTDDDPKSVINIGSIAAGQKKSFFIRVNADREAITGGRFYVNCSGDPI